MIINIVSQVLNVALNFLLIIVLHKGVLGAAIGSCISIVFGLNGVWLMATAAGLASGILTLVLAKTMKLKNVSAEPST